MALSDEERERCRYHLGYLNLNQQTAISLGFPSASHLGFILESSMNELLTVGEPGVRRAIQEMDCIEDQMSKFRTTLQLQSSGAGVKFSGDDGMQALEHQYLWWRNKLSDTLGSPPNPFSLTNQAMDQQSGVIEPT